MLSGICPEQMIAFEYLQDKDVFQKFYIKFLARRLIHGLSISDEAEAQMVSRLKTACGTDYTSSVQKMIQDIAVSQDLNNDYQEHVARISSATKQRMMLKVPNHLDKVC